MVLDTATILKQIDEALAHWTAAKGRSQYSDLSDLGEGLSEVNAILAHAINRFAPTGSTFKQNADKAFEQFGARSPHLIHPILAGSLKALRTAYASNYLQSVQELVHADVFADFLEMAEFLNAEGYKDAAAVLCGGVLEEQLRKLCAMNGITILDKSGKAKKASSMNDELSAGNAYDKLEHKNVTAWLDLRNKAAHGRYKEYDGKQVEYLLQGVRDFLGRHPA